jgi:hypothetical protein
VSNLEEIATAPVVTASLVIAAILNVALVLMFFYAFFAELRRFLLSAVGKAPGDALTFEDVGIALRVLFRGWGAAPGAAGGGNGGKQQPRPLAVGAPGDARAPGRGAGSVELAGGGGGRWGGGEDGGLPDGGPQERWAGPPEERV